MLFDDGYAKIVKSSKMTKISANPIKVRVLQIEVMLLFLKSLEEISPEFVESNRAFLLHLVSPCIVFLNYHFDQP